MPALLLRLPAVILLLPSIRAFAFGISIKTTTSPGGHGRPRYLQPSDMDLRPFALDHAHPPAHKKTRPSSATDPSASASPVQPPGAADADAGPRGTLFIPCGPQCAGKTTLVRRIFAPSAQGVDVTLDDQPLVYVRVPTDYFLGNASAPTVASDMTRHCPAPEEAIHGKTIRQRIDDASNDELRWVIKRLGNTISAEEFAARVGDGLLAAAVDEVIGTVRATEHPGRLLPETVDLFVRDSLFRPRPAHLLRKWSSAPSERGAAPATDVKSALDHAQHLLKSYATDPGRLSAPLSWGNTNTQPREYAAALDAAVLGGRPVEFVVFGGEEAWRSLRGEGAALADGGAAPDGTAAAPLRCLPRVEPRTLVLRNLHRFLRTGRYIPAAAIATATERVESMVASAVAAAAADAKGKAEKEPMSWARARFQLDYQLAKKAGYHLRADRTVAKEHHPRPGRRGPLESYGGRGRGRHNGDRTSGRHHGNPRWNDGRHDRRDGGGYRNDGDGHGERPRGATAQGDGSRQRRAGRGEERGGRAAGGYHRWEEERWGGGGGGGGRHGPQGPRRY